MQCDREKLKELMLYVAARSATDPNFGAIKLNKILYFSDFLMYGRTGQSITGCTYQKLDHGPAPREIVRERKAMAKKGEATTAACIAYGHTQKRLVPLREANLDVFTASEISLVDFVIEALQEHNARQVSDMTHDETGWKLAALREDIPYNTVFLAPSEPTSADRERAYQLAAESGW